MTRKFINERDRLDETPDPTPIEVPGGLVRPPTIRELIQQTIRQEYSNLAHQAGMGTFEEEDDFEDPDPLAMPPSQYVLHPHQADVPAESFDGSEDNPPARGAEDRLPGEHTAPIEAPSGDGVTPDEGGNPGSD